MFKLSRARQLPRGESLELAILPLLVSGFLPVLIIAGWLASTGSSGAAAPKPTGIDATAIDRSVRPGDDFDAYASGRWSRSHQIPAARGSIGTIDAMSEKVDEQVKRLVIAAQNSPATAEAKLLADFYSVYMSERRIEANDVAPLKTFLVEIQAASDKATLAGLMGKAQADLGRGFFRSDVWLDSIDPSKNRLRIHQDGLGMASREAYLGEGAADLLNAYRKYVERTLKMINWPEATTSADAVVQMEVQIANESWSTAQNRDRTKRYNPMSANDLIKLAPEFPWADYLKGLGYIGDQPIIVQQKQAFPGIARVFRNTPISTLKAWQAFNLVDRASPYLSARFKQNRFEFRGRVEEGTTSEVPRSTAAVQSLNELLPDAVGKEYVRLHFPPTRQAEIALVAENFRKAMANRIHNLSWMSADTKREAREAGKGPSNGGLPRIVA